MGFFSHVYQNQQDYLVSNTTLDKRFPEIHASISFCKFGIHSKIYRCLQLWIFGNFCKIFHYAPNWLFRTTNCKVSALEWTAQCYRMNNLRHLEFLKNFKIFLSDNFYHQNHSKCTEKLPNENFGG